MADVKRIPQVSVQEVVPGGAVTGVAPVGAPVVDSAETLFRGLYRKWTGCTDGGLFALPAAFQCGWSLTRLLWNLPGGGGITVNLIDDDGFVYPVYTTAAASGAWVPPDDEMLILPGWSLQVTAPNPLGAAGRLVMFASKGWHQDTFLGAPIVGDEQYPPSRQP